MGARKEETGGGRGVLQEASRWVGEQWPIHSNPWELLLVLVKGNVCVWSWAGRFGAEQRAHTCPN